METLTEQELYDLATKLLQRIENGEEHTEIAKEVVDIPFSVRNQLIELLSGPNWPPEDVK